MRKLLPVVFCSLAAISYIVYASDTSVKAYSDAKWQASGPAAATSNENRADPSSTTPSAQGSASASTGASTDKPAKRDVKKQKSKQKEDSSSGASTSGSTESSASGSASGSAK